MVSADMEKVSVTGSALVYAPVNQLATLIVHNVSNETDLIVTIKGPNGSVVPKISKNDVGAQIDFLPNFTGEHHIDIKYKGNSINGSPFATKIYDIKQIKVKEMPKEILIGKPVTFIVEAKNAGPGNLEIIINNGNVPSTPQALGSSQYAITFLPKEFENHQIDIRFNGELVQGVPFICSVLDLSKIVVQKDGLDKVPVNSLVSFFIESNGTRLTDQQISITGPASKVIKFDVIEEGSTGYKVSFIPTELGDHMIDIKLGGESVPSCPFLVRVYDAKRVKVTEPSAGEIGKLLSFSIDASQAGAGNLEIIVTANGRYVHNYVIKEGNAKFRVNFKPIEPDAHMVNVKFNGESVPGSPFMVKIIDSSQSVILGDALRMASLTKGIDFTIENKNDRIQDCIVHVTCDNGKKMAADVEKLKGSFRVNFIPIEIGPHAITIILDGVVINGCPFNCNVYDVSKVKVSGLNTFDVGKPVTFQIDAVEAGEGTLEILVTNRKTGIRPEVDMKSRGLYDVTFVPQEKISHYIRIIFNEEDVPGSPFKIEMKDLIPKTGLVGSSNIAIIDTIDPTMEVKVVGPQKTPIVSKVTRDVTTFKVEFVPKEVGLHRIEQFIKGNLIAEKTSFIEICDPSRVKLIDVQDGVIGREQIFKIDCTWAGRGNLSVNIKTATDIEVAHSIKEISTGVFLVTYTPKVDSAHFIDVRYNDHQAPGCPQMVEIRDPTKSIIVHGPALKSCVPEEPATFLIETGGFAAAKNFDVIVTDPNGSPLNIKCYQQKDGSLLAEFTPQRTGPHKIDVLYQDSSISGSPFTSEVFDASKVTLQRIKSTNFIVNEKIFFTLNRKDAGYAELDFTVTSPLGRHLPIEVKGTPDGEGEIIEFIPTVPGKYKIAITFGGIEIPGSPVTFIAQEGNLPVVEGNGLKMGFFDQSVEFTIDARNLKGVPEVRVDGPDSEPTVDIEENNGIYRVSFVPTEVGIFDVRVLWNRKELPGSPFHPKIINLEQVRPIGGWESIFNSSEQIMLQLNEKKRISFDVTGAGPGKLTGFVKFPDDKVEPAMIEQTAPHKFRLSLMPKLEGEYQIRLNFGDQRLPKSPLIGVTNCIRNGDECATVVLRGQGLAGARVGEETQFILDGTDAGPGTPEITLNGVKADIPIKVSQINERIFKATYTPTIQGTYLLNVLWAGKQVKGCPLKVSILPRCDASRVLCSGEGLKGGAIDQEIKAFIDTRRAGPGDLSAHCIGPNKVAFCELLDQMDGTFNLFIKPQEPGKHSLTIKYGGENIRGSPFTLKIAGSPDASKVRVHGPGIEHGVLPLYMSRFICDTRGAGYGDLIVQIRGPRGAFRADMQRVNQNDRIILCKYDPTEPGDYTIEVKYSGKHVPGSPFNVMIFDTQDELNRYNSRQYGEVGTLAGSGGSGIGTGGGGGNERGVEDGGIIVGNTKNNGHISKTNKHNHNNNHSHHPHAHHHPHHIRSSNPPQIIPGHLPPQSTIVHSPHFPGHPHHVQPGGPSQHPPVDYHAYSIYGPTSWRGSANEL